MRSVWRSRRSFAWALAALTGAGSAAVVGLNSKASISVTKPEALRDILSWPWRAVVSLPLFIPWNQQQSGPLQSFSFILGDYSVGSVPKNIHLNDGTGSNCCSKCLGRDSFANAAAKVGPAVVNLSVPQGLRGLTSGKSIGSGTIIDSNGTILTCAHVVVDTQFTWPATTGKIEVTLQDGRKFEGIVENLDLHSDIAIVKIKSNTPLPTATLGSSQKLRPGDWVIAMGCPLSLHNTITAGIVSCVERKSSDLGLKGMHREYLQTDCAINAGNSGGPLVNVDGEVIGVNIMKVYAADGLAFSVPIDSVAKIIQHFKKSGRVTRPWLGLKLIDLNKLIIAQLKEKDPKFPDIDGGVLIPMVTPRSPAERAGFRPGDCIIEFDGHSVGSMNEILDIMGDRVGVPLKVVVKRANNVSATLTVVPEEANQDI